MAVTPSEHGLETTGAGSASESHRRNQSGAKMIADKKCRYGWSGNARVFLRALILIFVCITAGVARADRGEGISAAFAVDTRQPSLISTNGQSGTFVIDTRLPGRESGEGISSSFVIDERGVRVCIREGESDSFVIDTRGNVAYGLLITPTDGLSFGSVKPGQYSELTFTLLNRGTSTITGQASAAAPYSVVSGGAYNLAQGGTANVTVRFSPTAGGNYQRSATFTSPQGTVWRTLTGIGQADQTFGCIWGKVTNANTGAAMVGARVELRVVSGTQKQGQEAYTGSDGFYSLDGLQPGTYQVAAGGINYELKVSGNLTLTASGTIQQNLALTPKSTNATNAKATPVLLVRGRGTDRANWYRTTNPDSNTNEYEYWQAVRTKLEASGFTTIWDPNEPASGTKNTHKLNGELSIEANADNLVKYISEKGTGYSEINIVAHSMGGLIVRRAVSKMYGGSGSYPRVRKVIMLSTPNAGSIIADYARDNPNLAALADVFFKAGTKWQSTKNLQTDYVRSDFAEMCGQWPSSIKLYIVGGDTPSLLFSSKALQVSSLLFQNSKYTPRESITGAFGGVRCLDTENDGAVSLLSSRGEYYEQTEYGASFQYTTAGSTPQAFIYSVVSHDIFSGLGFAVSPGTTVNDHFNMLSKSSNVPAWVANILSRTDIVNDAQYADTSKYSIIAAAVASDENSSPSQQIEMIMGSLSSGKQIKLSLPADGLAALRILTASDSGGLKTTLRAPSGAVVSSEYTTYGDPATTAALAVYEVKNPASGSWTVVLDAAASAKQAIGYSVEAHGDSYLTLFPTTTKKFAPGQEVLLSCAIQTMSANGATSVTGAIVKAVVTKPDSTVTTVTLSDDGLHGDGIAKDGLYAGTLGGTIKSGEYQVRYRADGINPTNKLVFRRVANGDPLTISSGSGFIAGNIQSENVDTNGDGVIDFIRVQCVVDVATSGTYSVSAELVDVATGTKLLTSQTITRPLPGASTISLFFDRLGLPTGTTAGPFRLENLRLYLLTSGKIQWVDDYQSTAEIQSFLSGMPTSAQISSYLLGENSVLAEDIFDINGDGKVDIADLISNINAGR